MSSLHLDQFTPSQIKIPKGWFFLGILSLLASGMGLMGLGGLVAIISGAILLVIIIQSIFTK